MVLKNRKQKFDEFRFDEGGKMKMPEIPKGFPTAAELANPVADGYMLVEIDMKFFVLPHTQGLALVDAFAHMEEAIDCETYSNEKPSRVKTLDKGRFRFNSLTTAEYVKWKAAGILLEN